MALRRTRVVVAEEHVAQRAERVAGALWGPATGRCGVSADGLTASTRLRYVEACAGAGGMGLGLHMAGWTGTGMERDPDAVATHNANVGPCLLADITTASVPHGADLVAGGVPCQPFSVAGLGEALDDPRGQLFTSLLRLAVEAGARCVVMENVRGLVFKGVLPVIATAFRAHGFHTTHAVLCAEDYGVPQARRRVFIVGFRDPSDLARFRWPTPSHGEPGNLFRLPRHRTIRDALCLGDGAFAHGLLPHADPGSAQGMRVLDVDRPAPTVGGHTADLLDRPSPTVTTQCQDLSFESPKVHDPLRRLLSRPGVLDRPAPTAKANSSHESVGSRPGQRGMTDVTQALSAELARAGLIDRTATTITSRNAVAAAGHHASNWAGAVRLDVGQLAALQSFPAGFAFHGNVTSQHRQVGNAVPPLLAAALGRSIATALYGGTR